MLMRIEPNARVFTIDTGVLFPETYTVWREIEQRYGLYVEVHDAVSPDGAALDGRALLRRAEGGRPRTARSTASTAGSPDCAASRPPRVPRRPSWSGTPRARVWKANPLADWTDRDVWNYIFKHDLPYNPLHDRGYDSIGCAPCTVTGRRSRGPLGRKREDRVRPARRRGPRVSTEAASVTFTARELTHLDDARVRGDPHHARGGRRARAAGAAVQRGQGLDRPAAPGREGLPAGPRSRSR